MGIDVHLKDERGEILGSVLDPTSYLSRFALGPAARQSRLLRYLDPAGDLVLNRAQATTLLEDLAGLIPSRKSQLAVLLEGVRELAERAEQGIHLYLWFQGD